MGRAGQWHRSVETLGTPTETLCLPPSREMPGPDFWPIKWQVLSPEPQMHPEMYLLVPQSELFQRWPPWKTEGP